MTGVGVGSTRAADDGSNWEVTDTGGAVTGFVLGPAAAASIAAVVVTSDAGTQLKRSTDTGATWRDVPLPALDDPTTVPDVALDPTDPNTVFASGAQGLFRTTDNGGTWALVLPDTPTHFVVAISPPDPQLVYVAALPARK